MKFRRSRQKWRVTSQNPPRRTPGVLLTASLDDAPGVEHPANRPHHSTGDAVRPPAHQQVPPDLLTPSTSQAVTLITQRSLKNVKMHLALSFTVLFVITAFGQQRQQSITLLCVIPTPRQIIAASEPFKPPSRTRIILGEHTTTEDKFAAEQINTRLAELQKEALSMVKEDGLEKIPKSFIYLGSPQGAFARQWLKGHRVSYGPELKNEGYLLDVSQDPVVIIGESATGRSYGVMTLVQILDYHKEEESGDPWRIYPGLASAENSGDYG